ncbi:MAG: Na+/H+ antiporter subunit E, partial [Erysipelotrichaceae bacterium]
MFVILFLMWIVFNGRFTLEIAVFGFVLSFIITSFMCRFMDYKMKYEFFALKKIKEIMELLLVLTIEIAKANEQLLYWIFSNKYRMEPAIVVFQVPLKKEWTRVILANCITLTPGTITAALENDEFTVHCLDKELGK